MRQKDIIKMGIKPEVVKRNKETNLIRLPDVEDDGAGRLVSSANYKEMCLNSRTLSSRGGGGGMMCPQDKVEQCSRTRNGKVRVRNLLLLLLNYNNSLLLRRKMKIFHEVFLVFLVLTFSMFNVSNALPQQSDSNVADERCFLQVSMSINHFLWLHNFKKLNSLMIEN